jgi:hypothetical protein
MANFQQVPSVATLPQLTIQNLVAANVRAAQAFPQDAAGTIASVAKRVAANVIRAANYATRIAELSKAGKTTEPLRSDYSNWYQAAIKLQQLLADEVAKLAAGTTPPLRAGP